MAGKGVAVLGSEVRGMWWCDVEFVFFTHSGGRQTLVAATWRCSRGATRT